MKHERANAMEKQYPEYSDALWEALRHTFSKGRQEYYLHRALQDKKAAFELHHWNTRLSESLYVPLQAFEIALRNRLDIAITTYWRTEERDREWYEVLKLGEWRKRWCGTRNVGEKEDICNGPWSQICQAKKKLKDDKNPNAASVTFKEAGPHDKFVAAANFTLWVQLLHQHYAGTLWRAVLCRGFPNPTDRADLYKVAENARDIRNRIMHYEPVFEEPLCEVHEKMLKYMRSWCPETADMIARMSRFTDVWNNPPEYRRKIHLFYKDFCLDRTDGA